MATITEDYVSLEIAKLLKQKGFEGKCSMYYDVEDDTSEPMEVDVHELAYDYYGNYIEAPTTQMAMKWLREVHGLHISLEPCYDYDSMHVVFLAFVQNVADVHEFMDGRKNVASNPNAEKSCELAIKYCLENLI